MNGHVSRNMALYKVIIIIMIIIHVRLASGHNFLTIPEGYFATTQVYMIQRCGHTTLTPDRYQINLFVNAMTVLVKYDIIRNCVGVQFVSFCTTVINSYNFSLYKYCNMPVSNHS